jgi:crotonobetainyl-CoA:carnitine CoA-transferase CaiB-like acyl-CoA transferase
MVAADASGARAWAPPFMLSGAPFAVRRPAPAQGEHSIGILRDAGMDAGDVAALVAAGVVRQA